jgi:hypothetical protein
MRYLLLAGATFIVGYIAGVLFGYRSAVVDYVENDAATIRTMADSMYDTKEKESLPEAVQEVVEGAEGASADDGSDDSNDGPKGFQ